MAAPRAEAQLRRLHVGAKQKIGGELWGTVGRGLKLWFAGRK